MHRLLRLNKSLQSILKQTHSARSLATESNGFSFGMLCNLRKKNWKLKRLILILD